MSDSVKILHLSNTEENAFKINSPILCFKSENGWIYFYKQEAFFKVESLYLHWFINWY